MQSASPVRVGEGTRQAPLYSIFTCRSLSVPGCWRGNLTHSSSTPVLNESSPAAADIHPDLANRSTVLGTAKNGPIYKAVATVCVAVVGLLSFVVLIQTVFGLG
jgi:hypothetical protein